MIKSHREACLACENSILDLAVTSAHVGLSLITISDTTLSVISPVSAISYSLSVTHSGLTESEISAWVTYLSYSGLA